MADRDVCTAAAVVGDDCQVNPGTRSWKQVTAQVLALLNELDPYRLDPGMPEGAPKDEYAPEADALARHLISDRAIELEQVDAIWLYWFGESLSQVIGPESAEELVAGLNRLAQVARPGVAEAMTGGNADG